MIIRRSYSWYLEAFFITIQLFVSSLIVFLSASFDIFFFSFLLFINTFSYFFVFGFNKLKLNFSLNIPFLLLSILISISFINFIYPYDLGGFMMKDANLFEIFCFMLVWYFNFLFFSSISLGKFDNLIKIFTFLFFIAAVYSNYRAYTNFRMDDLTFKQHHYFYFSLTILPLCFLFFSKNYRYFFFFITFICVLLSFKRSGVVVTGFIFLFMLFIDFKNSNKKLSYFIYIGLFISSSIYYSFNYLVDYIDRIIVRFSFLQDDGGSGRFDNALLVLNSYKNDFFPHFFIGNGFWAMYRKDGHFIDIEWFSILYYYGIFAFLVYLYFHFFMIKRILILYRLKSYLFLSYISCYLILFLYSFSSELFSYSYLSMPLFIYLGYVENRVSLNKV